MGISRKIVIFLILILLGGILGFELGKRQNKIKTDTLQEVDDKSSENLSLKEKQFPALEMPAEYFDTNEISMGANMLRDTSYSVLNEVQGYRSYPSTNITFKKYSNTPEPLPPIKSDDEIHTPNPEDDFMGLNKERNVDKYGDLARRFVGKAGEGWLIDDIITIDLENDGKKEKLITMIEMGANIIAGRNIIVKDDKIIFATDPDTFSQIVIANNKKGFFVQWDDNFKRRDGYMVTRFIHDGEKYIPVYEQQIRYVRIIE